VLSAGPVHRLRGRGRADTVPARSLLLLWACLAAGGGLSGCGGERARAEACLDCHGGLETASPAHTGCVSCHGGDPASRDRTVAHKTMHGGTDASSPDRWEKGCGPCHRYQVARVTSSPMFTNAGMIAEIQATWEGDRPGVTYAARASGQHAPDGHTLEHAPVAALDNLSGELYRKFCARCHVARQNDADDGAGHPAGCAACHMPYADDATYRGGDRTMSGKSPHPPRHALQGLPPMEACARCHNRSGRVALSFEGLMDGNNGLVPTRGGLPGPVRGSENRSFTHVAPDVHFDAGMECIDCHTSREVMGDGYASADMHGQLEVRCEDCHGDGTRRPAVAPVTREHDRPLRESRQYTTPVRPGSRAVLTSRGRPYSNVVEEDGQVILTTKRAGRRLTVKVVTGSPEHRVAGHERLACSSCHARSVVQCYGCHTAYDKREDDYDAIRDEVTPGTFSETEDYRTLYPFPLALDTRGRISPVTPGCQTFVTVIEADGRRSADESVARYKGKPQLRFAAFEGHNTGRRAVGCSECHANPAFLGFGQHVFERGRVKSTLLCEKNPKKALDGFLSMDRGEVVSHAAITRSGARPLDAREVRRVFAANLCLICHDEAKDRIYQSPLDYHALDDPLHRRLLAPGR
jgi:hypothetical protein